MIWMKIIQGVKMNYLRTGCFSTGFTITVSPKNLLFLLNTMVYSTMEMVAIIKLYYGNGRCANIKAELFYEQNQNKHVNGKDVLVLLVIVINWNRIVGIRIVVNKALEVTV